MNDEIEQSPITKKRKIVTTTVPKAGKLLGLGRWASYEAAKTGDIQVLEIGRRKVVPVVSLESVLGLNAGDLDELLAD
jgi:hypothetical protein